MKHDKCSYRQNVRSGFWSFLSQNVMKMMFYCLKIPIIRKRIPNIFVMFGDCPYFLNKYLDEVCSNQLFK